MPDPIRSRALVVAALALHSERRARSPAQSRRRHRGPRQREGHQPGARGRAGPGGRSGRRRHRHARRYQVRERPRRLAPGRGAAHRIPRRGAGQRLRPGRRDRHRGLRAGTEPAGARAAGGDRPYDAVLDPLATGTGAEDHRRGPARPAGQHAGGGAGALRRERWARATAAAASERSRSSSTGSASRTSSTRRAAGLGLSIPPDLLSEASLVTNAFSARYGPGAVRAGERRHPRSRRSLGRPAGLRGRSAVRRIAGPRARPVRPAGRRADHRPLRRWSPPST